MRGFWPSSKKESFTKSRRCDANSREKKQGEWGRDINMDSAQVLLFSESRYLVDRRKIKKTIKDILEKHEVEGPVEISVSIVGRRKTRELNKKFRNQDHPVVVLTFSIMEGKPTLLPPDGILRLGDIVICYPLAVSNAAKKEIMVDEEINELVEHGLLNLLGIEQE